MLFPDSPRVIYDKNPLEQVICQLRFPPILKIDSELPADFQERIRHEYPFLQEKREGTPELLRQLPQEITLPPDFFNFARGLTGKVAYDFSSADELWTVSLTSGFIALTAHRYQRWEDFWQHFAKPFSALQEVYAPAFFTRIGLRYRNVIRKSTLGLEDASWSELLEPHIGGMLNAPQLEDSAIESSMHGVLLHLYDNIRVKVIHGLATDVSDPDDAEVCYLIDNDFYIDQRTEVGDALNRLRTFNQESRRLFRWCITNKLHQAMGPTPLE